MIDLPISFLKCRGQASEEVPHAFCCSTTGDLPLNFRYYELHDELALLVVGGLALVGYPPAQYTFDVIHRFAPILYWAFFVLFLLSVFRPRPK